MYGLEENAAERMEFQGCLKRVFFLLLLGFVTLFFLLREKPPEITIDQEAIERKRIEAKRELLAQIVTPNPSTETTTLSANTTQYTANGEVPELLDPNERIVEFHYKQCLPLGMSYKPNWPYWMSQKVPAFIKKKPDAAQLYFGELPFKNLKAPYYFAIAPTVQPNQSATLYFDHNRDGDLTNDRPASYRGTGTAKSAALVETEFYDRQGQSFKYAFWLWTSLPNLPHGRVGFNLYARCVREGQLEIPTGETTLSVRIALNDPQHEATFDTNRVFVDWNGNNRVEVQDWLEIGQEVRVKETMVRFVGLERARNAARFRFTPATTEQLANEESREIFAALEQEPIKGNPAPALELTDMQGRVFSLQDYRGKVLLLNFWATWCGPCLEKLPELKALHDEFFAQGFEIVAVSLDHDLQKLKDFVGKEVLGWRNVCDAQRWNSQPAQRYRIASIPANFLIDPEGRITHTSLHGTSLRTAVAELIARKPDRR